MSHPGRIFITDAAAGKPWRQPIRIVYGKRHGDFKIVDAANAVVRRFNRWRYAYAAYAYLCSRIGQEPLDDDAAWREVRRDRYERAAKVINAFKQQKALVSGTRKELREAARREREKRSTAFWKRVGGKPVLPTG